MQQEESFHFFRLIGLETDAREVLGPSVLAEVSACDCLRIELEHATGRNELAKSRERTREARRDRKGYGPRLLGGRDCDDLCPRHPIPFRCPEAEGRQDAGSGIGLTIAKAILDAHGGSITADSPGPGRGATFTVTLPAAGGDCPG